MIYRVAFEDIAKHWDVLAPELERSALPSVPMTHRMLNKILENLLLGLFELWVMGKGEMKRPEDVSGFCIISFEYDDFTGIRSLVLHAVNSFVPISRGQWREIAKFFPEYAKANGCALIRTYTENDKLVKIGKLLGGSDEVKLLTWRL